VKQSWRSGFTVPMRESSGKNADDEDLIKHSVRGVHLGGRWYREDIPALVAAMNKLVPVVETTKPPR